MKFYRLLFVLLLFMPSCLMYTPYTRTYVAPPEHWRMTTNEFSTLANFRWWEQLGDPVLNQLIQEAIENNQDLKVAVYRVFEYAAQLGSVRSELFPQISGNANAERQEISLFGNPFTVGVDRFFTTYTLLLSLTYEWDVWGRIQSASDAALADLLGQIDTRRTVVLTVVSAVAAAYIQLRQYDMQLEIAQKTAKSRQESFALSTLRFEGGLTSELEVKQSESEMENALVTVKELEISIGQAENLLSILVGRAPDYVERGSAIDQLNLPPCIPEGIPADIIEQRPDVLKAEKAIIAANANIGVARAEFFPKISLASFLGTQSSTLSTLFKNASETWFYGGSLSQPIFTGGNLTYQEEKAEAIKWEAFYTYQQTILTAFKEVNDALLEHSKGLELLDVQKKRVSVLTDYLNLATLRYKEGETDYLNVLDAERQLFSAQLDCAAAQSYIFLTLIDIYKALGGGWVIDMDCELMDQDLP
ncbi:MAG: transporter [Parachlamydia sp.]|nr:MAG: transporter [Parachlamydia sp.]